MIFDTSDTYRSMVPNSGQAVSIVCPVANPKCIWVCWCHTETGTVRLRIYYSCASISYNWLLWNMLKRKETETSESINKIPSFHLSLCDRPSKRRAQISLIHSLSANKSHIKKVTNTCLIEQQVEQRTSEENTTSKRKLTHTNKRFMRLCAVVTVRKIGG